MIVHPNRRVTRKRTPWSPGVMKDGDLDEEKKCFPCYFFACSLIFPITTLTLYP
ncbi:hypothetical protein L873DRAFT_825620 [Choiromyces venosus 120613-1]|uniref:Uncharacterized protein n=1 Tax=Choiromyces venosus 120613-1 TaxID=1336337 RepID=A0A3N4JU20_9PEZI|nr:hypothetical protein L873DRAFT_825620 [Choiromyces venosus 120613-1]